MLILVPWKPLAVFVLVMAAFIMFGYFASAFMRGQNPFAEDWKNAKQIMAAHSTAHPASTHKTEHARRQATQ